MAEEGNDDEPTTDHSGGSEHYAEQEADDPDTHESGSEGTHDGEAVGTSGWPDTGADHAEHGFSGELDDGYGGLPEAAAHEFAAAGDEPLPGYPGAETSWWSEPLDADLAPEPVQFTDPFADDSQLPDPSDELAWSDVDSLSNGGFAGHPVPTEPLSVALSADQLEAPTLAEQAVLEWLSSQ